MKHFFSVFYRILHHDMLQGNNGSEVNFSSFPMTSNCALCQLLEINRTENLDMRLLYTNDSPTLTQTPQIFLVRQIPRSALVLGPLQYQRKFSGTTQKQLKVKHTGQQEIYIEPNLTETFSCSQMSVISLARHIYTKK